MTEQLDTVPDGLQVMGKVVHIDESRIRNHLDRIVRGSVEETLNGMLDADVSFPVKHRVQK